jgi:hypothetical protein
VDPDSDKVLIFENPNFLIKSNQHQAKGKFRGCPKKLYTIVRETLSLFTYAGSFQKQI